MKKIYMLLAIGIIGMVMSSGCLSTDEDKTKSQKSNYSDSENLLTNLTFEPIEKDIKIINEVDTLKGLEPTAKIQFKVGETYIYHLSNNFAGEGRKASSGYCEPVEIDIPVYVEKMERINKSDYYVLRSEKYEAYPVCYTIENGKMIKDVVGKDPGMPPNPIIYGGCRIGINKNNPFDIIELGENFGICEELAHIQEPWMLYLNESTRFVQSATTEINGKECTEKTETTVIGSEKVGKYDCFKVEVIERSNCVSAMVNGKEQQMSTQNRRMYYIDKQKRVTVKFEFYEVSQGTDFLLTSLELKEIKTSNQQ